MVGDKLKSLRERKKWTLKDVEDLTEIRQSSLSDYENNKTIPGISYLQKLAKIFGVRVAYFFKDI